MSISDVYDDVGGDSGSDNEQRADIEGSGRGMEGVDTRLVYIWHPRVCLLPGCLFYEQLHVSSAKTNQ